MKHFQVNGNVVYEIVSIHIRPEGRMKRQAYKARPDNKFYTKIAIQATVLPKIPSKERLELHNTAAFLFANLLVKQSSLQVRVFSPSYNKRGFKIY